MKTTSLLCWTSIVGKINHSRIIGEEIYLWVGFERRPEDKFLVQAYPTEAANVASPQKTNWKLSTGNIMDIGNNVEILGIWRPSRTLIRVVEVER